MYTNKAIFRLILLGLVAGLFAFVLWLYWGVIGMIIAWFVSFMIGRLLGMWVFDE